MSKPKIIWRRMLSFFMITVFIFSNIEIKAYAKSFSEIVNSIEDDTLIESITRETETRTLKAGETFKVKYKINPKPIEVQGSGSNKQKEIVLVIDTSGSMNSRVKGTEKTRLEIAQEIVWDFVNKFSEKDNIKISLIDYNYYARLISESFDKYSIIDKFKLQLLYPNGSTNTGDALRVAYNLIKQNSNDKYIILMTDGEAEAYSVDRNGQYYTGDYIVSQDFAFDPIDNYDNRLKCSSEYYYRCTSHFEDFEGGEIVKPDYREQSLEYAKKIAEEKLRGSNINTYIIGFGGVNSKNKRIAELANGIYMGAEDKDTIETLYNKIQQIVNAEERGALTFSEIVSPNLEVVNLNALSNNFKFKDNIITGNINDICYKKVNNKYFKAEPIEFEVTYKAKSDGEYILGKNNGSYVEFKAFNKSQKKNFNEFGIKSENEDLVNVEKFKVQENINTGDIVEVKYKITPKSIPVENSKVRNKDVVLVIDTSGSMEWAVDRNQKPRYGEKSRLEIMKNIAKEFIYKFNDQLVDNNIRISLIEYGTRAKIVFNSDDILYTNKNEYMNSKINKLQAYGSTNIGDGLRQSYYLVNDNSKAGDKYIILMTDGEAEAYSRYKCSKNYYMDDGSNYETPYTIYRTNIWGHEYISEDYRRESLEYAEKVANLISISDVNTFIIGLNSKADSKNHKIANVAKGRYFKAQDENTITNIYNEMQNIVETNLSPNIEFSETISDGLEVVAINEEEVNDKKELKNGFKIVGNRISGSIKGIHYKLSDDRQEYIADPYILTIKYKVKKDGKHVIGKDEELSYINYSVLGKNQKKFMNKLEFEAFCSNIKREINILEIQPGKHQRYLGWDTRNLNMQIKGKEYSIKITFMPMSQFIGTTEEINGKYDVVIIGNKSSNGSKIQFLPTYYKLGTPYMDWIENEKESDYTSGEVKNYMKFRKECYKTCNENDITFDKRLQLEDFIKSGQLVVVDKKLTHNSDEKLKKTEIYKLASKYRNQYKNVVEIDCYGADEIRQKIAKELNKNEIILKPDLQLKKAPEDYDETKFEECSTLNFNLDVNDFNKEQEDIEVKFYIDKNRNGIFEEDEIENVEVPGNFNFDVPKECNGFLAWKIEAVRRHGKNQFVDAKNYKIGYTAIKSNDKKMIKVLQVTPQNDNKYRLKDSKYLKKMGDSNSNIYSIKNNDLISTYLQIDEKTITDFENTFSTEESKENLNIYDVLIFGYKSDMGDLVINNEMALNNVIDYIKNGKRILLSNDIFTSNLNVKKLRATMGQKRFKDDNNTKDKDIWENDIENDDNIGANIEGYTTSEMINKLIKDKPSSIKNGPEIKEDDILSYALKINDGVITRYPFNLTKLNITENNEGAGFDPTYMENVKVGPAKAQHYQLNLRDKNVIPWYTLGSNNKFLNNGQSDDNNYRYDPRNYYYFYTRENIGYTAMGSSMPTEFEEKLLLNFIFNSKTSNFEENAMLLDQGIDGQDQNKVVKGMFANMFISLKANRSEEKLTLSLDSRVKIDESKFKVYKIENGETIDGIKEIKTLNSNGIKQYVITLENLSKADKYIITYRADFSPAKKFDEKDKVVFIVTGLEDKLQKSEFEVDIIHQPLLE